MNAHVSPNGWPALVLNADFRPLSYYPLSLWSWQDAIKAVFLERVNIVAQYDRRCTAPSLEMKLPSVVSLKTFVKPSTHPAFTRFNVFLRDRFSCQYCGSRDDLTFDHLLPRSRGGHTTWINVVAACSPCNLRKGNMTTAEAAHVSRRRCRSSRACSTCTATAGCSRPTICTTAGSTISIGTPSWSRKRFARSVGASAGWHARPAEQAAASLRAATRRSLPARARSARCSRRARGRGSATPPRRSARRVNDSSCFTRLPAGPTLAPVPEHSCGPAHHFHSTPE